MEIIKRNGKKTEFDIQKVVDAVTKAADATLEDEMTEQEIADIARRVTEKCEYHPHIPSVEEVSDMVEREIMNTGHYHIAKEYIVYRYKRQLHRRTSTTDDRILSIVHRKNQEIKEENSNKNPTLNSTQRDYIAGEVSKDLTGRILLPKKIVDAHNLGIIHFHDADYFLQTMFNCSLVNLDDILQNGTVINGKMIESPKSLEVAANIACQAIAIVASNQYGGQTFSLRDLAPFVEVSRKKCIRNIKKEMLAAGITLTEEQAEIAAEKRLRDSIIPSAVQTLQYQLETLMTTNGQSPFVSMFIWFNEAQNERERKDLALLAAEVIRQRGKGIKNEKGVYVTTEFPKILYVLDEDNMEEGSEFFEITRQAVICAGKRMTPDFISAKKMKEMNDGDVYPCMGCRSFLTVDRCSPSVGNIAKAMNYKEGKRKYYGRFNQGVVTLNLVDAALSSKGDIEEFNRIMEERLELCHEALRCRHEALLGVPSDVAPLLFQYGAIARLGKGEVIDPLLYNGYSTISLGYAGLYECVRYMTGKSHTEKDGKEFAFHVMKMLNDACEKWKKAENIDYSVYGTPIESTTYRFAKLLQNRFGVIEGVTDHEYITNSYHVNVREEIAFDEKLQIEAEFQKYSKGGAISYVEIPNMEDNPEALLSIAKFIYETIRYAEFNAKSDFCMKCGYDGEIALVEEGKELFWECPECRNRDHGMMQVSRRTCGYIGANFWNVGKTREIKDRLLHVSIPMWKDFARLSYGKGGK